MSKILLITSSADIVNIMKYMFERNNLKLDTADNIEKSQIAAYDMLFIEEALYKNFKHKKENLKMRVILLINKEKNNVDLTDKNIAGFLQVPPSLENLSNIINEIKIDLTDKKRKTVRYPLSQKANFVFNDKLYDCHIENLGKGGFKSLLNSEEVREKLPSKGTIKFSRDNIEFSENFKIIWQKKQENILAIGAQWLDLSDDGSRKVVNWLLDTGELFADID